MKTRLIAASVLLAGLSLPAAYSSQNAGSGAQGAQSGATGQQNSTAGSTAPKPPQAGAAVPGNGLAKTLRSMDENATKFRCAQADFVWKIYNSVINDFAEVDKGKIYFRRAGSRLQMSAVFSEPASKQVIFKDDKVDVLQPGGQVDEYDTASHREELETFLVLGFGSSGEEIRKSFDIKDLGSEKVQGVQTEKLQLTPKAENIRNHVPKVILWIDPARGLSLQQQIFEESGDYRLAIYSNIQLTSRLSDNLFKLKGAVKKVVKH